MALFLGTLFPFQAKLAAHCYLRLGKLAVVDQGLGKSVLSLATAALLFDDDKIDVCVLICEQNKIDEWRADIKRFTTMRASVFHGSKRKIDPQAQIIISTYATWAKSLYTPDERDDRELIPTSVFEHFVGKRLLLIYDEMAGLGTSRTSRSYKVNQKALEAWREACEVRVIGLTATPMSTSPECFWNLGNLIEPGTLGTYKEFCARFVVSMDRWYRPNKFRDLDGLERKLSHFMLRKRKTDEDVRDQFPATVEKAVYLDLDKAHLRAYKSLDAWIGEQPEEKILPAFRELAAFACHPRAVLASGWGIAQEWAADYGLEELRKIPSIKSQAVIGYVAPIARSAEAGGVIVFSDSVRTLRCLAEDIDALGQDGFGYVEFHGGRSDAQNREAKQAFQDGRVKVMLASSKGERGINMPQAGYVVHFGVPTTHSSYTQRNGRASRIGSNVGGTVIVKLFVTRQTIEKGVTNLWMARNEWSDRLLDPFAYTEPEFTSALERKLMLDLARRQGIEAA